MRESIGGAWLFGIVIVFIALFSAFLTYSVSYTKAFNTKNKIISIIEEKEGYSTYDGDVFNPTSNNLSDSTEGEIFEYMTNIGYNYSADIDCTPYDAEEIVGQGYCIAKICPNLGMPDEKLSNVHYRVTTFIAIEIPFLGLTVRIPITGETRVIYSANDGRECRSVN